MGSETVGIQCDSATRISWDPSNSSRKDESNTKDRLAEFAKEVITLGEQNVTISPQMLKELSEKYHISPPST
ncbi:unnamed protein product [Adineta ricciae]|uniref:Uncharacterized protein n=1 Tax=Adineta ricciae TaxID=249248 RepID=A0A814QBD9_ADIRI|nr:unnamed protein product [Adineta ricciae]